MNHPRPDHAEHDSEDVWRAVCRAVQGALVNSRVDPADVAGISFDATCSLVCRERDGGAAGRLDGAAATAGTPSSGSTTVRSTRPIDCTATGHAVLDHLGGVMSPEMQTPKLMWVKQQPAGGMGARRRLSSTSPIS